MNTKIKLLLELLICSWMLAVATIYAITFLPKNDQTKALMPSYVWTLNQHLNNFFSVPKKENND
jgi:hypothetical protein